MDKIELISLVVGDKVKALEFYTEKMVFEKKTDMTNHGHRWVTVGPLGQDLRLELAGRFTQPDLAVEELEAWEHASIGLLVDNCYKMSAELKAKGVEFRRELEGCPQGVSAALANPDGDLSTIPGLPQEELVRQR